MDTLKDPKKQVNQLQGQIQDQLAHVSEEISSKVEIDQWRAASKSDFKQVKDDIAELKGLIATLTTQVNKLAK